MAVSKYKDKSGKFLPIFAIGGNEVTIGRDNVVDSTKILVDPDAEPPAMQPSDIDAMRRISPAVPGNLIMQNAQGDAADAGIKASDVATWVRLYNDNLLINGDFSIWQRGESFLNASHKTYSADRWLLYKYYGATVNSITKTEDGMNLSIKQSDNANSSVNIVQPLDIPKLTGAFLTISVRAKGKGQLQIIKTYDGVGVKYSTFDLDEDYKTFVVDSYEPNKRLNSVYIRFINKNIEQYTVDVSNAKLELGDHFTGFYPTDPATELMKCQRYYQIAQTLRANPFNINSTQIGFFIPLNGLRTIPTITLNPDKLSVLALNGATKIDGFTFSTGFIERTGFRINANKAGHGITDNQVILSTSTEGYALIDAEIY